MKKILFICLILLLSACTKNTSSKTPNELVLGIKDYSCKMKISYFSNKNNSEYNALQNYSASGKYYMEFLDDTNLKISFENSILNISSASNSSITNENYSELNQNPLFLSYFLNTYFNIEESEKIKIDENSIFLNLPSYNDYLVSAKLTFNNNLPCSLTYFDKNGNVKVNIIYNEFTLITWCNIFDCVLFFMLK